MKTKKTVIEDSEDDDDDLLDNSRGGQVAHRLQKELDQDVADTLSLLDILPASKVAPKKRKTPANNVSLTQGTRSQDDSDDEPLIPGRRTKACQVQPPPPSGLRRSARGQAPVKYAPAPVLSVDDDLPEDGVSEDQEADEDLPINATCLMQGRPGEAS
ncbi:hypothetical protein HG530_015560 [Fusarium avenaceum]|nr:hypothetical protein HG530_015560 [Fusarium avenaceum]